MLNIAIKEASWFYDLNLGGAEPSGETGRIEIPLFVELCESPISNEDAERFPAGGAVRRSWGNGDEFRRPYSFRRRYRGVAAAQDSEDTYHDPICICLWRAGHWPLSLIEKRNAWRQL